MKYFLFFAVGCFVAVVSLSVYKTNQAPSEINRGITKFERNVDTLLVRNSSEIILDSLIKRPELISYKNGHIFVADFASMQVFKFNSDWDLISKIGNGVGRGPGQLLSISDFHVEGMKIWIVDTQQHSIKEFSTSGELVDEHPVKRFPLRVVAGDSMITSLYMGGETLFTKINVYKKGHEDNFGQFIDNQIKHSLSLDGSLGKIGDSLLVYLPTYFSKAYVFKLKNGEEVYSISLPDGQKFPFSKAEETNIGQRITAPKDLRFHNTGIYLLNDVLLVAVYDQGVKERGEYVELPKIYFDVFDLKKQEYIKSYFFPGWFKEFSLNGERLYVITTVGKIYELELSTDMISSLNN